MWGFKAAFKKDQINQNSQTFDISDQQTKLHFDQIHQYFNKQLDPKKNPNAIYTKLLEGIKDKNWILRLKYLILIHYNIQNFEVSVLNQAFITQYEKKYDRNLNQSNTLLFWIQNQIINYYESYISKCCINKNLYIFCKQTKNIEKENLKNLQLISNGFKVLNLIRYIKQTSLNFNKLGRYYPSYKVMEDLFKMYIDDLKVYYRFLILLIDSILEFYDKLNQELLTHAYSLINSFLEVSDQMFEFCYNRYYYKNMKNYYIFPTIYNIDYIKYNKMVKYIQKNYPKINTKSRPKGYNGSDENNNQKLLNCDSTKRTENYNKYTQLCQFLQKTILSRNENDEDQHLFTLQKQNRTYSNRM